jgi:hypothetical protein
VIAEDYRKHGNMNVITLRPRGFIPFWNHGVYASYSDWARWFWKGAVRHTLIAGALAAVLGGVIVPALAEAPGDARTMPDRDMGMSRMGHGMMSGGMMSGDMITRSGESVSSSSRRPSPRHPRSRSSCRAGHGNVTDNGFGK